MNESLCIKGCVYRLSHDCQLDVDRNVSTAENRSSSCLVTIYYYGPVSIYRLGGIGGIFFFAGGAGGGDRLISFRGMKGWVIRKGGSLEPFGSRSINVQDFESYSYR